MIELIFNVKQDTTRTYEDIKFLIHCSIQDAIYQGKPLAEETYKYYYENDALLTRYCKAIMSLIKNARIYDTPHIEARFNIFHKAINVKIF